MPETNETRETKTEKKPIELTYAQKLTVAGWNGYHNSAKVENLANPDKEMGTLGFTDSVGMKQTIISLPAKEWIRILTELAKKAP